MFKNFSSKQGNKIGPEEGDTFGADEGDKFGTQEGDKRGFNIFIFISNLLHYCTMVLSKLCRSDYTPPCCWGLGRAPGRFPRSPWEVPSLFLRSPSDPRTSGRLLGAPEGASESPEQAAMVNSRWLLNTFFETWRRPMGVHPHTRQTQGKR